MILFIGDFNDRFCPRADIHYAIRRYPLIWDLHLPHAGAGTADPVPCRHLLSLFSPVLTPTLGTVCVPATLPYHIKPAPLENA
jgi:hypothetical protein